MSKRAGPSNPSFSSDLPVEQAALDDATPRKVNVKQLDQGYVAFNSKGALKYRELQTDLRIKMMIWTGAGGAVGAVSNSFLEWLFKSKIYSQTKLKRLRVGVSLAAFVGVAYHGFKLVRRDYYKGVKLLQSNPEYVIDAERTSDLISVSFDSGSPQPKS